MSTLYCSFGFKPASSSAASSSLRLGSLIGDLGPRGEGLSGFPQVAAAPLTEGTGATLSLLSGCADSEAFVGASTELNTEEIDGCRTSELFGLINGFCLTGGEDLGCAAELAVGLLGDVLLSGGGADIVVDGLRGEVGIEGLRLLLLVLVMFESGLDSDLSGLKFVDRILEERIGGASGLVFRVVSP